MKILPDGITTGAATWDVAGVTMCIATLCSLPNWRSPSHYIFICPYVATACICYCERASRTSYAHINWAPSYADMRKITFAHG